MIYQQLTCEVANDIDAIVRKHCGHSDQAREDIARLLAKAHGQGMMETLAELQSSLNRGLVNGHVRGEIR